MKPITLPTRRIHIQQGNRSSTLATRVVLNGVALETSAGKPPIGWRRTWRTTATEVARSTVRSPTPLLSPT